MATGPSRTYKRSGAAVVSQTNAANEKVGEPIHRTRPVAIEEIRGNVGISYVALRPMKVNGVQKFPGDLIPEANAWRNLHNYLSTGHLAVVGA